jgi:hypothetical protein
MESIARVTYGMPTSRKVLMTWFVTVMAYIWSCSRVGLSLPLALLPSVSQRCSVLVALYASFTASAAALAVGLADESEESIVDAQALAVCTGVSLWKRYSWTQDITSSPKGTYTKAERARPPYATRAESENVLIVRDASWDDWWLWFSQFVKRTAYVW